MGNKKSCVFCEATLIKMLSDGENRRRRKLKLAGSGKLEEDQRVKEEIY